VRLVLGELDGGLCRGEGGNGVGGQAGSSNSEQLAREKQQHQRGHEEWVEAKLLVGDGERF